jgi:2-amino-4-hydroxy-6-hydroxymethyldihydropteridine diphosphokinase
MPFTVYIALGSNLGNRRATLDGAIEALRTRPGIVVTRISSFHETDPEGGPPGQGKYLNAAAELSTDLSPRQLINLLLEVEKESGRVRRERYGPRTLDLDLLLYGDLQSRDPDLMIPHPRMHERLFVLEPLVEIAPKAVHPLMGLTVHDLLQQLQAKRRGELSGSPGFALGMARGAELAGMRAVVTGATSGIGRAIALELASAGADVVIHGRRSLEAAQEVAERVQWHGVRSHVLLADLHDVRECRRLVQTAWECWKGFDVWVNNAGADTLTGEALHWPFERKLEELLAVDVRATMVLARDAGLRMKERGTGTMVNMGWDQAETGMDGDSGQLFAAAKAAVMAFSKSLALSLAPQVRVNCVAPGWIKTAWGETASARWQERVVAETPLQRWGTSEDVARTIRWLVSPGAAFVTGQVIRVNGGVVR